MKKYFYLAAVSAMMLTACSSDKDVLQPTPEPSTPTVAAQQQAVAFDTYLSGTTASTRAGDPAGVMTTDKLKTTGKGFGVFAFYHNNATYPVNNTALKPDFMFNEQIHWANGWTYSPLKYWPNETDNDSQSPAAEAASDNVDKLSFFAYAPYANLTTTSTMTVNTTGPVTEPAYVEATPSTGILAITKEDRTGDPLVEWKYTNNLDNNVDLLWGVAPAGMAYQTVNPNIYINKTVGLPLTDMVKPDKDQKMKFLFQHALSRIGLSVVSAIDQIAAGDDGNKFNKEQTRVLIDEVTIWGDFGIQGVLNLNNTTANVANWIDASVAKSTSSSGSPLFTIDTTTGYLSPDLRYASGDITAIASDASKFADLKTGVLPSEQVLMLGGPDPSKKVSETATTPAFDWGKTYYKASSNDYVLADVAYTNSADLYTYDETKGKYTQVYKTTDTSVKLNGSSMKLYTLTTGSAIPSTTALTSGTKYYNRTGSAGSYVYTLITSDGSETAGTDDYYLATGFSGSVITGIPAYGSDIYWTALMPRYFMVIPSTLTPAETPTNINVRIKYHVVTKDTKLSTNTSDIANDITKSTTIQLRSGKSYNLKLILGLTSVKLDATVADWQIADDAEVWLPKNVE